MSQKLYLFIALFLISGFAFSQNTLIKSIDFESTDVNIIVNSDSLGTHSGNNKWIINAQYSGGGVMPNTISQDSTYGGLITFPNGTYLHIHDSSTAATSNVSNTNYDPTNASDRFTLLGDFCTLGFTNIVFAFFYTGIGDSANAYAEIVFSANGGAWLPANNIQYRNRYKWKYEEIFNPAFDGQSSLRIGVRWRNTSSTNATPISFGIDDIRVAGDFDPGTISMGIDQITPTPVCQGNNLLLFAHFDSPLCGNSSYQFELSNASGSFNNPTNLGIYSLSNLNTFPVLFLTIPDNTPPGTCYKIRFSNLDYTPHIFSDTTICFEIQQCPNTITTLEPAVLMGFQDTVCVGSVIDVPFWSLGIYNNNTYVAQLSDSAGNFPANPNVLGTSPDDNNYDPSLDPGPGSVSGLIAPLFHPIPPGCNYYIRVNSINPAATGTVYGPFCIRECDIESNNKQDVQVCLNDLAGFDSLLTVNINEFDSAAIYDPANEFQIQIMDKTSFAIINTGVLGTVVAHTDTTVLLSIPISSLLGTVGLQPGLTYMRIVSTLSSTPWNQLGTVIRLMIGVPNPSPLSVVAYDPNNFTGYIGSIDTTICFSGTGSSGSSTVYFYLQPDNSYTIQSTYQWRLNGTDWPTPPDNGPYTGILFNGPGDFVLSVTETNNGCVGPGSDTAKIHVIGPPTTSITGPTQICSGDTAHYSVPLQPNSYYNWVSVLNASIYDTLNNECNFFFPNSGLAQIRIRALNECGSDSTTKSVQVRAYPTANAGNDTTVCPGNAVKLKAFKASGYGFKWFDMDSLLLGTKDTLSITPTTDTTLLYLTVSTFPSIPGGGCKTYDTVMVVLKEPGPTNLSDTLICQDSTINLKSYQSSAINYVWSTGDSTDAIDVSTEGTYYVTNYLAGSCAGVDTFKVNTQICLKPEEPIKDSISVPNVFTPNGDALNNVFQVASANIENFQLIIYDRWGLHVATLNSPLESWDGKYGKGGLFTAGTYFYALSFNFIGKKNEKRHGYITLIR